MSDIGYENAAKPVQPQEVIRMPYGTNTIRYSDGCYQNNGNAQAGTTGTTPFLGIAIEDTTATDASGTKMLDGTILIATSGQFDVKRNTSAAWADGHYWAAISTAATATSEAIWTTQNSDTNARARVLAVDGDRMTIVLLTSLT